MKYGVFIFMLVHSWISFTQDYESRHLVKTEDMEFAVFNVFPEAVPDIFMYSNTSDGNQMIPDAVSFYVPEKYFKRKKLDMPEIERRVQIIIATFDFGQCCPNISISKKKPADWLNINEHDVREITIYFGIGC